MPEKVLAGWGNHPRQRCDVHTPLRRSKVAELLQESVIARGLGRSYGDAALGDRVIDCTRLDRYVEFNESTGVLTCESGVSLEQIITDFAPRGWFPMITPGTKFVTIGGCIANDVHGKAHHVDGCFSQCVLSMEVLLSSGDVVTASRDQNSDLFWASMGGMGLLGIVLQATIQLRQIETTFFRQTAVKVGNLDELLDALDQYEHLPYSVAWVDSLATGKQLGRGVLTVGDHASRSDLKGIRDPLRITPPSPIVLPFEMPSGALNGVTVRILNGVLDFVQSHGAEIAHYEKFFYPLDFVGLWNRGYGPKGFTQYQFVIPLADGRQRIREILERITTSGQAPFLNVLKKFGKERGLISFPFEGYTFAIDFPVRDGLAELLRELDRMVLDAGGRIYLGKDAFVDAATFKAMYPKLPQWQEAKAKYDPNMMFESALSKRVGLT